MDKRFQLMANVQENTSVWGVTVLLIWQHNSDKSLLIMLWIYGSFKQLVFQSKSTVVLSHSKVERREIGTTATSAFALCSLIQI